MARLVAVIAIPLLLGACADVGLRDLRGSQQGPDEFIVSPNEPLQQPDSYSELPVPTPGQANLTDKYPLRDAVRAAGGRPEPDNGAVPARDGTLVQHASRLGVEPNVRETLAEEDERFRKRKARFTQFRIVPVDRYNQAYKRQSLNAGEENERWRRAGARTPSAPPYERRRSF